MASFGCKSTILQKSSKRKFIDVAPDKSEDNVVVTYEDNITIYDTCKKRVLNSWSVKGGQQITSPAIYNKQDNEYVFVVNHNIIQTHSESNFDQVDKFTVSVPIFRIIEHSNSDPLVVFINGEVRSLSQVFENPKFVPSANPSLGKSDQIVSCQLIQLTRGLLTTFVYKCKKQHFLLLTVINNNIDENVKIQIVRKGLTFCSGCISTIPISDEIQVVTLWSDGSLCKSTLPANLSKTHLDFSVVTSVILHQNSSFSTLFPLTPNAVAICCKGSSDITVSSIDLKFGLCHDNVNDVKDLVQIRALNGHMYLVDEVSISSVPFVSSPVNLFSVCGMQTVPSSSTDLTSVMWSSKACEAVGSDEERKYLEILLKSQKDTQLLEAWNSLLHLQTHSHRMQFFLSPSLSKLLERFSGDSFSSSTLLKEIIQSGLVSTSVCPHLITTVLKRQDLDVLLICLNKLKNISENDLIACLEVLISDGSSELMETGAEEMSKRESLIDVVLSLPFTECHMKDALHNLSYVKMMILISTLEKKLESCSFQNARHLSYEKVLSWLSLLLDSHYTELVVSPDSWEKLVKLRETVGVQMEMFDEINQIEVLLTQIQQSLQQSRRPTRFTYNIEMMKI